MPWRRSAKTILPSWQPDSQLLVRLSHCQRFAQHVTQASGKDGEGGHRVPARQDLEKSESEKGMEQRIEFQRVGWLGAFGVLIYAPTNHWWFAWQERYVTAFKTRPAAQAALRVGVHSAVYAPFSVAAFIAWVAFLEVRENCPSLTPLIPLLLPQNLKFSRSARAYLVEVLHDSGVDVCACKRACVRTRAQLHTRTRTCTRAHVCVYNVGLDFTPRMSRYSKCDSRGSPGLI